MGNCEPLCVILLRSVAEERILDGMERMEDVSQPVRWRRKLAMKMMYQQMKRNQIDYYHYLLCC